MLKGPAKDASKDIVIVSQVDIDATPEQIWPYLVDWEHLGRWMVEASEFEVVSPHREGVGVEALATVSIGRITTRDRIRVTRWEPPAVLEIAHLGWVHGHGYLELTPLKPRGTNLFWRERLAPPMGLLGRMGMRFYKKRMEDQFDEDLLILRALIESEIPPG